MARATARIGRGATTFYFYPDDVMPLYDSLKAAGIEVSDPFVTFYGMKEIVIHDPDGYCLCFGLPTDEPASEECD